MTRVGEVRGVVVSPHEGKLTWDALRLDVGAADRDEALEIVRPGDPIALHGPPEELPNGRVLSGALDDRVGVFACLDVLRRVAADPPEWDVALVVSAQEETGTHGGARVAAERLAPDVAIAVDVSYAADAPGIASWGERAPRWWPDRLSRARRSARSSETACSTWRRRPGSSSRSSPGTPPTVMPTISSPPAGESRARSSAFRLRYMHTAGEIVQLSDVDDTARLIEAYARSLTAEASFLRDAGLVTVPRRRRYPGAVSTLRHRFRRPDPVWQARGGLPREAPGDGARRDRDQGGPRAFRRRPGRGRLRRDGTGAPGRGRAGSGAPGGDRRRDPDRGPGRHDQQGLRLVDPCDCAGRSDDPRRDSTMSS